MSEKSKLWKTGAGLNSRMHLCFCGSEPMFTSKQSTKAWASELKKVAILAIQDWGTLWESGEHFYQKTMQFFQILRYVNIYTLLRPFSA